MSIALRLLLVIFLLAPTLCRSQQKTNEEEERRLEEISRRIDRKFTIYVGMPFGEFSGTTPEGKTIDNAALRGKVTLALLWYPSLASSGPVYKGDYLKLGSIPSLRSEYPDFQILSITADTSALSKFRSDNPEIETYTVVNLNSHSNASKLALIGMPSAIIVDRQGKIAHIVHLGKWTDLQAIADKIRALALR